MTKSNMKNLASLALKAGWITKEVELECPQHGRYIATVTFKNGKPYDGHECPECRKIRESSPEYKAHLAQLQAKAEREREEERRVELARREAADKEARLSALRHTGIPDDYFGKLIASVRPIDPTVKEAVRQARLYVDRFDALRERGIGFCFYGECGTGKTMLACAILQELIGKVDVKYATVWDAISAVRKADAFKSDTKAFEALSRASLLVIDEIGASTGYSYEESYLMSLIDARVSRRLPTIFVSNLVPDVKEGRKAPTEGTIRTRLGDRVFNRICGSSVFLLFRGVSQRKRVMSIDEALEAK